MWTIIGYVLFGFVVLIVILLGILSGIGALLMHIYVRESETPIEFPAEVDWEDLCGGQ